MDKTESREDKMISPRTIKQSPNKSPRSGKEKRIRDSIIFPSSVGDNKVKGVNDELYSSNANLSSRKDTNTFEDCESVNNSFVAQFELKGLEQTNGANPSETRKWKSSLRPLKSSVILPEGFEVDPGKLDRVTIARKERDKKKKGSSGIALSFSNSLSCNSPATKTPDTKTTNEYSANQVNCRNISATNQANSMSQRSLISQIHEENESVQLDETPVEKRVKFRLDDKLDENVSTRDTSVGDGVNIKDFYGQERTENWKVDVFSESAYLDELGLAILPATKISLRMQNIPLENEISLQERLKLPAVPSQNTPLVKKKSPRLETDQLPSITPRK